MYLNLYWLFVETFFNIILNWSFWIVLLGLKYADNILFQIKAIDNRFQL